MNATKPKSYFPLLVEYTRTGERVVVRTPEDILSGEMFKVLETNYNGVDEHA